MPRHTAIIHLREPPRAGAAPQIDPLLRVMRGVDDVEMKPAECVVAVRFDQSQVGLAEIVRVIEDAGSLVAGVAQRTA